MSNFQLAVRAAHAPMTLRGFTSIPQADYAPTIALTAFYRRHRRAILTVNRFSGINTAVPLFKASLPF